MELKDKLLHASVPVILFEMVPPAANKPEALEAALADVKKIRHLVDAINLPEIHDESRGGDRTFKFIERVEPRKLGALIQRQAATEVVINRCVVYEADQTGWFRETEGEYGIQYAVLVGGESSAIRYAGPTVLETVEQVKSAALPMSLGGITIPSRLHEADRIRRKHAAGISFFTTQVLFDSNDIVSLVQRLNGLEVRIFLSFAPVSQERDLTFLRWLGADVPRDLDRFLIQGDAQASTKSGAVSGEAAFARSLDLAQRILMDVFDNLPPDPPLLGLNIEHINKRNFSAAVRMIERLGNLYANLVVARAGSQ
jgi:5,10-methylenetetrahydrofolate reductase